MLETTDFSEVLDAPTQIRSSAVVEASGDLPTYCKINGYVTPNVGIKVGLPYFWNGKFIEMGCGGHCGVLDDEYFFESCGFALRKGYACLVSDMGHSGKWHDGLWAYNDLQAKIDWGYRATHVAALAGKAIAERYYTQRPKNSYFMGCSTGGRQALQEAQRFPWDFDGIVAGAPPIRLPELYMMFAWGYRATHTSEGRAIIGLRELRMLTEAAIAQCDKEDGLVDGVIGSPLSCRFRPSVLLCKSGQTVGCLNADQVRAAEQIYTGPTTSAGRRLLSGGPLPGSEFDGLLPNPALGNWSGAYLGVDGKLGVYSRTAQEGFRYLLFDQDRGPSWKITDFDFDADYKRLGVMGSIYDSSNPDLRHFRDAGGKLLIYSGTNDNSVLPRMVTDYYDEVVAVMGGRQITQQFARFFLLPGVGHCLGGPGADTVDYLTAIENWVERGTAPDRLVAYHLRQPNTRALGAEFPINGANIAFSRPVFPYPVQPRYKGSGDPKNEGNFVSFDSEVQYKSIDRVRPREK